MEGTVAKCSPAHILIFEMAMSRDVSGKTDAAPAGGVTQTVHFLGVGTINGSMVSGTSNGIVSGASQTVSLHC